MLKNNDISIPEACYADLCKVGFFERKQVKLTIIWNEKISRNKQILTLKKLYPELNKVSMIILGISEPPVRTLRATIPENERHIFR